MTKKISKIIAVIFMTLFITCIAKGSYARQMTSLTDLGNAIKAVNPKAESAYVIGNYVFTSGHDLEIQDVMLTARSINVTNTNGKTNKDPIYGEMTIYTLKRKYDENMNPTGWEVKANLVGNSQWNMSSSKPMDIKYIDYNYQKETYTVTFNYDDGKTPSAKTYVDEGNKVAQPTTPTRDGYRFDGWYLNGEKYEFNKPVTGNITLTAKWLKVVDVDSYVETAAEIINTGNKFKAKVEGNKVKVMVKNATASESITAGGSMAFVALTNMMNNDKNIESVTMEITEYSEKLTLKNGTDYYTQVKDWLTTYFESLQKPELTFNTAKNSDLVGKTVKVTVTTIGNAVVDGTTSKTVEYEVSFKAEKNVSNMVSKVKETLEGEDGSGKYNVTINGNEITVEVKAEERGKSAIGGTNTIVALGKLLEDNNVDHIVLALGNETKDISDVETAKDDILGWLATTSLFKDQNVLLMNNEELYNLVKNADLSVTVVLKDAMSESGNESERYTVTVKLEEYAQVAVDDYVEEAKTIITNSQKFDVTFDEKNVTVRVLNNHKEDGLLAGGTNVFVALTEMFKKGHIASMTMKIDGYETPLTVEKDVDYYTTVKNWLEKYLQGKDKEINSTKLDDMIGTKFSVKVKLTEDAKIKDSNNQTDEETYTVEIRKQAEVKNVANMVESVKKVLEGDHEAGKYTVTVKENQIDVKVKAENREDNVIGETGIIVALQGLLNGDNNIDHIALNYCGCNIDISSATTAKTQIIEWVIQHKDTMFKEGTLESLNTESITKLTNEALYNMLKDTTAAATITVVLNEDVVSENKNEEETYTITFGLEDYTIVKEQEVIKNLASGLETAGKFTAIVDENNPKNVTVTVNASNINDSINQTGTGVILALTELFNNNNVATLTINYDSVSPLVINKNDNSYVTTITNWLTTNNLQNKTNKEFAGKTISVKANLTPDARTVDNKTETEYTITIKLQADIAALQQAALNLDNNDKKGVNKSGKLSVKISGQTVTVTLPEANATLYSLVGGSGTNNTLEEFLKSEVIDHFTVIIGETKVETDSQLGTLRNYVDIKNGDNAMDKAAELAGIILGSLPSGYVATQQELADLKTPIKVELNLADGYVLAEGSYLEYTLDFVV